MMTTDSLLHRYLIIGRIQVNIARPGRHARWIYPQQLVWARDEYEAKLRVLHGPTNVMETMFEKFPQRNGVAYDAIPFLNHAIFHCPHDVCDCDLQGGTHCRWCRTFHNWIRAILKGPDGKGLDDASYDAVVAFEREVDLTQWRPSEQLIAEYDDLEQLSTKSYTSFR